MQPTLVGKFAETQGGVQYSTGEVKTQRTCPFTGKRIYTKAIDFGALASSGAATVAHGISSIDVTGDAYFTVRAFVTTGTVMTDATLTASVTIMTVDATNVVITSSADLTGSTAQVYLEYTKT